jgi:hypothetical protein
MAWLTREVLARARREHPEIGDHGLDALLASGDEPVPASLAPVWYADA